MTIFYTPTRFRLALLGLFWLIAPAYLWATATLLPDSAARPPENAPLAIVTAPKALTSCRPTFRYGCNPASLNSLTVNSTMLSNGTGCSPDQYASYTAVTTNVTPGLPVSFTGTFTNGYDNGVTIWADANRDGIFGAGEIIYQTQITTGSVSVFSGSLTIPPNTDTGPIDVRVVILYNDTATDACGVYSYGETEDYTLNVIAPTTFNPTTTNIGLTSAVLAWNNLGTASGYDVQWRQAGGIYTTISGITTPAYSLTGLSLGTAYEWQMRPTAGTYSSPVAFTTNACSTPNSFYRSNGATSAYLSWSSQTQSIFPNKIYEVQIQVSGASSWSSISGLVTTQVRSLTGLTIQTAYIWRVRADCSLFSAPQTFTTTACDAPTVNAAYDVTHNSAKFYWSDNEVGAYTIQYRPLGGTWTTVPTVSNAYSFTGLTVNTTYQYAVNKVCTSTVSSPYSATQSFTTACKPLANAQTSRVLPTSAQLSWYNYTAGVPPADVQLQWRPTSQSMVSWTTIDNIPGGFSGSYSLTGLTTDTNYQWQARSVCGVGVYSAFTAPLSFITQSCQAPTSLNTDDIGINQAYPSWSTGQTFEEQQFTFQWRPASLSATTTGWTSVSGLTSYQSRYQLQGLEPSTAYQWRISKACTPTEVSDFTNPVTFTTQPCTNGVSGLQVGSLTFGSVELSWGNSNNVRSYNLQWRPKTTPASNWNTISNITTTDYNRMSYSLTGLSPNTVYEYQVAVACSPTQSSTYVAPYSFTTLPCSNLATNFGYPATSFNAASLNWAGPATVGYALHYRPAGSITWIGIAAPVTRPYTLTGLTTNAGYEVEIASACSATQVSAYSNTISFTTTCCNNSASGLSTFGTTFNATNLNWQGFASNPFDLRWRPIGSTTWTDVPGVVGRPYALTGLNPTTPYEWQLAAVYAPGQSTAYTPSNSFTTTACTNVATGLTATGTTFIATNLNWNGPISVLYNLRWRPADSVAWNDVAGIISRPYTLTGLISNTIYEWQLATVCTAATSLTYTGIASFTTIGCSNVATNFITLNSLPNSATLSWNSPPGVGSSLQYRVASAVSWQTVAGVVNAPYVLTGLSAGTAYEFQVASVCGPGQLSGYAVPVSFTTTGTNTCPLMYTVKDGSWDDPTIWACNRVPLVTDAVQLKHRVTVPNGYLAYALKINFDAGSKLVYGTASRLLLNQ